jgi:peptidyl-tRNA hydrolase, PTH1 family
MMNNSGKAVSTLVKSQKSAQNLIVLHDDLDMGLGSFRILYNRGSGGHRGVESIRRAVGTEEFIRVKIGVSPVSPSGKIKKPKGDKVSDFIVGDFKKPELDLIKKVSKDISSAVESIIMNGKELAMTDWN